MKRRILLFLSFIIIYSNSLHGYSQKRKAVESARPNIIFILTDDQRWDALGHSGNEIIHTPQMDKLASEGVYFRNAFVTTPICAASRASIFSGLHERTHKYTFQTGPMQPQYMQDAYPKILKKAGYYTGFYGKFGVNYPGKEQMFDVIEDYDRNNRFKDYRGYYYKTLDGDTVHLTRYTGQQAVDFIDDAPSDQPFCLSLSFSAPHAHDGAPEQYFWQEEPGRLYQDLVMPDPMLKEDKYFETLPKPVRDGFNRLRWTWRYDTPEKYQHSVKGYYRMIYGIDLEIAKIRAKLKDEGIDKNTVIILMGDNGYFLGERQLAGKWLMYDNSVRVPLIIHDPRYKKHLDIDDMALNIDVPATILDLAGIEKPEIYQGKSLVPISTGKQKSLERDTILIEHLWEFEHIPPSEGVRTVDWKYMRYVNDKSSEELYHLAKDPQETKNLASSKKHSDELKAFRQKTDEFASRFADPYSGVPSGLTVEYIREPQHTKIIDNKPEFGWFVPREAVSQKGYQILVASSEHNINNNIGDVWDSGNVRGNQSIDVELGGQALQENTNYFWKVRIFDKDNRLSEYSDYQQFTTGTFGVKPTSANSFQKELIEPITFKTNDDGSYFADFGKDAFGTLNLEYTSKKNENLTIRLGEKLKDGKIDRKPGGNIRFQEVELKVVPGKTKYQLELVPDQRNTKSIAVALPDSFPVIMPFRYVEIEGAANLQSDDLEQEAYFHYFKDNTSAFSSSNEILNEVWEMCKYSQKATSFAGFYVDGDRERIPYEADAYLNQLSHYSVDNEYAIARRTIEYFMDYPTWPTEWQLHVALLFHADYMYTGNSELIEKYYEPLKHKTLMELEYRDGLISTKSPNMNGEFMAKLGFADTTQRVRDIVDWPPAQKDTGWKLPKDWPQGERDGFVFTPVSTVINSFFYQNMKIMAEFARILNKPVEALDFEMRAAKVKKSMNELLFNHEKGYYKDGIETDHGAIHSNMLPLAFGIVPESYQESVVDYIKTRGMGCSVYGAQFLMEALYIAGAEDYALELMTATHDRGWYNMIKGGSTISWEAWDLKYKPNQDWNHAWGAAPANIVPRYMWGIQPKTPGYGMAVIKPQLASLRNSSIVVPTIRGRIKAAYEKLNDRLSRYSVEIPANMVAEFVLDIPNTAVVNLNGQQVNLSFGSLRLEPGVNDIEIRINSF